MRAKLAGGLVLLLCAGAGAAVPDTPPPQPAPLACAGCRTGPTHARLLMHDGRSERDVVFPPAPYVSDGAILVYPGETLVFRFPGGPDGPGTPVFEKQMALPLPQTAPPSDQSFQSDAKTEVTHDPKTGENFYLVKKGSPFAEGGSAEEHLKGEPPNTMIVSYHQVAGRPDMTLRVEHNFLKPLKYDALMERAGGQAAPEKTSTCPVMPVLAGSETWPYPLGAIRLTNLRFVDTSQGFNCD